MRLHRDRPSWPEFTHMLRGLMQSDTRLARYFTPRDQPERPDGGDGDA